MDCTGKLPLAHCLVLSFDKPDLGMLGVAQVFPAPLFC